jgi:hypothetical protein
LKNEAENPQLKKSTILKRGVVFALNWDSNGQRKDILSVEDDSKELVEMRISDDGTLE